MARSPALAGTPVAEAFTRSTGDIPDEALQDLLVVDGPFGLSGVYPLTMTEDVQGGRFVRHCNLYFVKLAVPDSVREKAQVVVDRSHYRLADGIQVKHDGDLCTVCVNKGCPHTRNPQGDVELAPGKLVLPL